MEFLENSNIFARKIFNVLSTSITKVLHHQQEHHDTSLHCQLPSTLMEHGRQQEKTCMLDTFNRSLHNISSFLDGSVANEQQRASTEAEIRRRAFTGYQYVYHQQEQSVRLQDFNQWSMDLLGVQGPHGFVDH